MPVAAHKRCVSPLPCCSPRAVEAEVVALQTRPLRRASPEEREKRWNATDTYISEDAVAGMAESEYDIPPAMTEPLTA